jgi:hypothetical protein
MSVSAVAAPSPLRPPERIDPKPPEVKAADDSRASQPTVRAPLPPGQGTRIDQIA